MRNIEYTCVQDEPSVFSGMWEAIAPSGLLAAIDLYYTFRLFIKAILIDRSAMDKGPTWLIRLCKSLWKMCGFVEGVIVLNAALDAFATWLRIETCSKEDSNVKLVIQSDEVANRS